MIFALTGLSHRHQGSRGAGRGGLRAQRQGCRHGEDLCGGHLGRGELDTRGDISDVVTGVLDSRGRHLRRGD